MNSSHHHGGMSHQDMSMHHGDMTFHPSSHHGMDHVTQVHSYESECHAHGEGNHMMSMAFHGGYCEVILFNFWNISSLTGLLVSMLIIMFAGLLYEMLKYYRESLFWKSYNGLQYRSVTIAQENGTVNTRDNRVVDMVSEVVQRKKPKMFSQIHAFQTILHTLQITVSYGLMLIFMTYNVWLCTAVVIGSAMGYFLFGWKKSFIVDVTEHCH